MTAVFSVFTVFATLLLLVCGLALLPALLVVGAVVLAFTIAASVLGLVFRLFGWLLLALLAFPLMLLAGGLALAFGVAIVQAALPLLLIVGVVWLIARHHRDSQAPARAS